LKSDLHDPANLVRACAAILDEKKITDIQIYDVGDTLAIAGYFLIGTGLNARHLQGVVDNISRFLRENGLSRRGIEGYSEGKWILFDLGDIVIHLFLEEGRKFYDLELLWGDCPRLELELPAAGRMAAP
jgi:ribosome-associated protein